MNTRVSPRGAETFVPQDFTTLLVAATIWAASAKFRRRVKRHLELLVRAGLVQPGWRQLLLAYRLHALYFVQLFLTDVVATAASDIVERVSRLTPGVLVLTIHQGPWDAAGAWLAANAPGDGVFVVARPQRSRVVDQWVRRRRDTVGARNVWAETAIATGEACRELLLGGQTVVIFIDRDYWSNRRNCSLFGADTRLPVEVVRTALSTASSVVVGTSLFNGRHAAEILYEDSPAVPSNTSDEGALLTWLSDIIEALVSRAPIQWHMFSNRW